jgi:hypothetical protein
MPDEWEIANGLNPFVNDALGDPDGDGQSNFYEYRRLEPAGGREVTTTACRGGGRRSDASATSMSSAGVPTRAQGRDDDGIEDNVEV